MHSAFPIRTALLSGCMVLAAEPVLAQSNAIFSGGAGDGFATLEFSQSSSTVGIFNGGNGDGYASLEFAQPSSSVGIFNGGNADGFASLEFAQSSSTIGIFNGGVADGWASSEGSNIPINLEVYLFLEGPFDPGQLLMRDDLRSAGLVPLTEPYTALGYPQAAGGGGETTTPAFLAQSGNDAAVDWVRVELRDATDPTVVVATRQALVLRDGTVSPLTFGVNIGVSYYVAVRHRNHLGCMTAAPVLFTGAVPSIGFLNAFTSTYGTDARKVVGTERLLWAGDVNRDRSIKYTGIGNDRDPILVKVGGTTPNNTVPGYWGEDVNLDGTVKYTGANNDRDRILVNVGGTTPNHVRSEQVP